MRPQIDPPEGSGRSRASGAFHQRFADEARFIKAWFENPGATGAVSPSGRFLARAMARCIDMEATGPVVELGPGTGPVTQALLQRGLAPERLILVEYDPAFCRLLERRFPGVRVIQGDAYDLATTLRGVLEAPAAAIVSSLPLLNRPDCDRLKLLGDSFDLLGPNGVFVQFTYGVTSPIPRRKPGDEAFPHYSAEASQPVWLNLPPARVWCYRPLDCPVARKINPAQAMMVKFRAGSGRVKDEFLETCDRIETEIRLARDRVRLDIERRAARVRADRTMRPAMDLLRRIGEPRKRR